MINEKETTINFNSAGRRFFYRGEILSEDDNFVTIKDRKLGIIRLNKHNIISIQGGI